MALLKKKSHSPVVVQVLLSPLLLLLVVVLFQQEQVADYLKLPQPLQPLLQPLQQPQPQTQTPPPSPFPRAFLGEAGHDVTAAFERALRKEVPDGTKARIRYFRRFHQQRQELREREREREREGEKCRFDDGRDKIRLWGCYRPSRLDSGGGDAGAMMAQEALFGLAFSGCRGEVISRSREVEGGEEDSTFVPPPFSREALALELAELGWGLFTGGEDRAERLRASRRRRLEAKRGEE